MKVLLADKYFDVLVFFKTSQFLNNKKHKCFYVEYCNNIDFILKFSDCKLSAVENILNFGSDVLWWYKKLEGYFILRKFLVSLFSVLYTSNICLTLY